MKLRWRFGVVAGFFLAVFALYPQGKLIYNRGAEWNGHYAYNDIDEVAYASYLKALIDGRPRKNDPYSGRDGMPGIAQEESFFSIQFAGPYTLALPSRLLGIDAGWAMTISGALAAFLSSLAIFWLIGMITKDSLFAMAGALIVLCFGAIFAGEGAIGEITGWSYAYPYFPGFRRYVPAVAITVFFALIGLVWRMIGEEAPERRSSKSQFTLILLSIVAFGYLVFSYFYMWTTAAAWLACLVLCWLVARPNGFWPDLKRLGTIAIAGGIFLIPYAYLLSQRSHTMDDVQMLVRSHAPDLTRPPALISYAVLLALAVLVWTNRLRPRDRGTLFALSLALTPIVLFNQQVLTGQELQPIHYQVFTGNYVAGLAAVVTLALVWRDARSRQSRSWRTCIGGVALVAVLWGFVECHYTVRILDDVNIARDEAYPAARRLVELAKGDADALKKNVLHLGIAEADDLPTIAPQPILWARHQHLFAGIGWQENKERYYQLLYYYGVSPEQLANALKYEGDFVSMIALFGWSRHTNRLTSQHQPLTFGEIDDEVQRYAAYTSSFDARRPDVVRLDYLIAPSEGFFADNVDKWYERDAGESFGKYTLYTLSLRAE